MPVTRATFLDQYQRALDEGVAAAFVGAGLSVPAGFVDWKEMLRGIAVELELNVDEETDLIALAQYHNNHARGRGRINQMLIDEYTRDATPTENHHLLAALPFTTVWTTNYDHLIEEAYALARKRVDKKVLQENVLTTKRNRDVVLYKMHGDVDAPNDAVLTKSDYERFDDTRHLFSVQLKGELLSKTMLFLGYSFNDPNVHYILARVRSLVGEDVRPHYWITRDANSNPRATNRDKKVQRHRIEDLKTYGIRTLLVNDYSEITDILRELTRRVDRRNVFFSGSAHDYEPLGKERVLGLLRRLGGTLIKEGYNVVSGMGLGVGDAVAMGAIETVYRSPGESLADRTILRPFPQPSGSADFGPLKARYREEMLARTRSAIFVLGNKLDATTQAVVPGVGVRSEYEIARRFGVTPIPIAATGHVAAELANEVNAHIDEVYGGHAPAVKPHLDVLADVGANDDSIVKAVIAILKLVTHT
ncbi:MAG: SIR2 family protein [Polyangiales bacterium]